MRPKPRSKSSLALVKLFLHSHNVYQISIETDQFYAHLYTNSRELARIIDRSSMEIIEDLIEVY